VEILKPIEKDFNSFKENGLLFYFRNLVDEEDIERFKKIKIEYFDRFGKKQFLEAEDFLSVALQHEIDHLKGILFVDKLSIMKRKKFEKEYKKILKKRKN